MKNTVYAFARRDPIDHVESFASRLAEHFSSKPGVSLVRIEAAEHPWARLGRRRASASARVRSRRRRGVDDGRDARRGRHVDRVGTARARGAEDDRLGVLRISARSVHDAARDARPDSRDVDHGGVALRDRLFAISRSARRSARRSSRRLPRTERVGAADALCDGEAALAACGGVVEIQLSLPNRHHLLVDLAPFGLDNPNEIFVATEQPYGLIEATDRRS